MLVNNWEKQLNPRLQRERRHLYEDDVQQQQHLGVSAKWKSEMNMNAAEGGHAPASRPKRAMSFRFAAAKAEAFAKPACGSQLVVDSSTIGATFAASSSTSKLCEPKSPCK